MKKILGIGLMGLSLVMGLQTAHAAYELSDLDAPVPVISGGLIQVPDAQPGMDFHATLAEPVHYQGMVLPEGTEFIGHIDNIRKANPWGHINRMDIWVDQVIFPNQHRYTVYRYEQAFPNSKFKARRRDAERNTLVDAGEKLYLRFQPYTMKGLLNMGMNSQP